MKKFTQHYTIVTPDGGYWHGSDTEPSTLKQNSNPTDWGCKEDAEKEIMQAIDFCKKNGWWYTNHNNTLFSFILEKYGEKQDWDGIAEWGL